MEPYLAIYCSFGLLFMFSLLNISFFDTNHINIISIVWNSILKVSNNIIDEYLFIYLTYCKVMNKKQND